MNRLLLSACAAALMLSGASPALAQFVIPPAAPALPIALPPIPAPADKPYPGVIKLAVDATDLDRHIFQVRETIPVTSGPMTLLFPQWLPGNHSPSGPVANLAVAIYCAKLFGMELSLPALFAGGVAALAISVGTVGLPGQVSFFASIAPICLAMGVPLQVLPLLLAVEVVPDIFRTVGNVTADLAAARIVEGRDALAEPEPGAGI